MWYQRRPPSVAQLVLNGVYESQAVHFPDRKPFTGFQGGDRRVPLRAVEWSVGEVIPSEPEDLKEWLLVPSNMEALEKWRLLKSGCPEKPLDMRRWTSLRAFRGAKAFRLSHRALEFAPRLPGDDAPDAWSLDAVQSTAAIMANRGRSDQRGRLFQSAAYIRERAGRHFFLKKPLNQRPNRTAHWRDSSTDSSVRTFQILKLVHGKRS